MNNLLSIVVATFQLSFVLGSGYFFVFITGGFVGD